MKFSSKELIELELQLSKPTGSSGIRIAENMNKSNIQMTLDSIEALELSKNDILLEIGHGNCGHLENIYAQAKDIQYFGLEISETMKLEAEKINEKLLKKQQGTFFLYDGIKIPFPENYFDKIFTVNTIYFWENPKDFIAEINSVLKMNGICILTFAQKSFMKNLPFVNDKFCLYDTESINLLVSKSGFKIMNTSTKVEVVKSKTGELIKRIYTIVTILKSKDILA
jgi:SAM-dependent methyltransferase